MTRFDGANARSLGRILGYPECCIDRWLESPENAAVERGTVLERPRSAEESATLAIQARILAGYDDIGPDCRMWDFKEYVPCEAHMGTEGWRPW